MNGFESELSYEDIEKEVRRLCTEIGGGDRLWVRFRKSDQNATPHIEIDSAGYHLIVCERGKEYSRETTRDPDQLYFLVMAGVAETLGMLYESKNRDHCQDPRRIMFAKSIELLGNLSEEWANRLEKDFKKILVKSPYRDEHFEKSSQCKRQKGET